MIINVYEIFINIVYEIFINIYGIFAFKHHRIGPVVRDCIRDLQEQFIDILTAYSPKIE